MPTQVTNLKIWLPGRVSPKARARTTKNGSYLPQKYREWRQMAESDIVYQVQGITLPLPAPVAIEITLRGKCRGDADNLAGAALDALVAAGVISDDRISIVPRLVVQHSPGGETGCVIEISPMEIAK